MVPMPGAREAAARRYRRDHFARLRVLGDRHAAERGAHDHVVEIACAAARPARSATSICCCAYGDPAFSESTSACGRVELGLADDLLFHQALPSLESQLALHAAGPRPPPHAFATPPAALPQTASAARVWASSSRARICPS